jgi:hypothetical protein
VQHRKKQTRVTSSAKGLNFLSVLDLTDNCAASARSKLVERLGIEPKPSALQADVQTHYTISRLDAVSGVEPATRAYETRDITRCSPQ